MKNKFDLEKIKKQFLDGEISVLEDVDEEDFYFIQIPVNFVRSSDYKAPEKMVYMYLKSFAGVRSSCFPSQKLMAKELNMSIPTVIKTLKDLQEKGGLLVIKQKTTTNRKTANLYILAKIKPSTGLFKSEGLEKFKVLVEDGLTVKETIKHKKQEQGI